MDDKAYAALQAYGQRDDVSISWLIRRAVAEMIQGIERQEKGAGHGARNQKK